MSEGAGKFLDLVGQPGVGPQYLFDLVHLEPTDYFSEGQGGARMLPVAWEGDEVDISVQGCRLVGPVVGIAHFAAAEVEEVEAVDGVGVPGASCELPPPLSAVVDLGEAEQAGEVQGSVDVGGLVSELGQVCGGVVAVQEGGGQGLKVFVGTGQHGAPQGAPVLTVERALDAAEKADVRLCSPCGAAQELEPLLSGFDRITEDR
ncbi:hypothetical protein ACWEO4_35495 [Streptomyces sp. NPDC004393]